MRLAIASRFPFKQRRQVFFCYLEEERGLRENTVYHYSHRLSLFQDFLQPSWRRRSS